MGQPRDPSAHRRKYGRGALRDRIRTGRLLVATATALLCLGGGIAFGQSATLDAAEPDSQAAEAALPGTEAEAGAEQGALDPTSTGARSTGGSAGAEGVRLVREDARPPKTYFRGVREARFKYEIGGGEPRDLVVMVARKGSGEVVRTWEHESVEPGELQAQTWDGSKRGGGTARNGEYRFKVLVQDGSEAERTDAEGRPSFWRWGHKFPVRARHSYGDGLGGGRGHQGQDVFADCGTNLVAARAGKVKWKAYQGGGAGYYVVIRGKKSGKDYVYMHLKRKATVHEGERVRTGEKIGEVGQTGNASGCHLHFELWSKPGWYEGGKVLNPTRPLKRWDKYS